MPKPTKLTFIAKPHLADQDKKQALEQLEELRARIESGQTLRWGYIECRANGDYTTAFSSGMNKREDAAMLMDLAFRLLGFVSKNKDGNYV